ncbi:perilipin mpl1-like protein [Colletotrichum truncatum]|uniref:Perilipin mpl1-like protein n=1 Tax=Colletotrichum truncatum TaxID=5467 RepID=A0ACC3Z9S7_COLTU|nr:perilipin mpl1-like protein [Colletotrichum truncatum]KAF6795979.1 perilipin mpl1-like protein [Colletotrichum truncatum]
MSKMAQVNGDLPAVNSATAQHLLDIPVFHDGVVAFRNNPYGKKSIALSDSVYQTLAVPFIPYFRRPWGYLRPYAEKADALGDQALTKVEERVPVIKKPTEELVAGAKAIIALPIRTGLEAKDHVFKTYAQEKKKVGGDNLVAYSKALVSTTLITSSELIIWVGDIIHHKKEETKDVVNEKANN